MKISIIASAIRPHLWEEFSKSLVNNKCEYEIIFAGPKEPDKEYPNLIHIKTGNIKPAQCYYIASLYATGDLVHWTADDAIYPDGILDDVAEMWAMINNPKVLICPQTLENSKLCEVQNFLLYDRDANSPVMAPFGFMSLDYMRELGGIADRRYTGGQYENDLVLRLYADGGKLYPYKYKTIEVDHVNRHLNRCGSALSDQYPHGRKILEASWPIGHYTKRQDFFEPFENKDDLLTSSQSYKGIWD